MSKLYTIKPLEWKKTVYSSVETTWRADGLGLGYYVLYVNEDNCSWGYMGSMGGYSCDSVSKGKRLAEEHWQERMKECLIEIDNTEEVGDE